MSRFEVGAFLASSLGTAWPRSRQYSRCGRQSGHRWENCMKKVTRADASLRITSAPLPSARDRTNQPTRLCRSSLASSSPKFALKKNSSALCACVCVRVSQRKEGRVRADLSVFSLMMTVKAPKNLTWSFDRSSMPCANCQPDGDRCSRCRASCVLAITSGCAGWYKAKTNCPPTSSAFRFTCRTRGNKELS